MELSDIYVMGLIMFVVEVQEDSQIFYRLHNKHSCLRVF